MPVSTKAPAILNARANVAAKLLTKGQSNRMLMLEVRGDLYRRIRNESEWWYTRAVELATSAKREDDPAVRMVMFVLGRFLPETRETELIETGGDLDAAGVFSIGAGLTTRGTLAARETKEVRTDSQGEKTVTHTREVKFTPGEDAESEAAGTDDAPSLPAPSDSD